jgi:hypothetical protein
LHDVRTISPVLNLREIFAVRQWELINERKRRSDVAVRSDHPTLHDYPL